MDQDEQDGRGEFSSGMSVWDRFTGEGPWILEHRQSVWDVAALKHVDGGRDRIKTLIENAWALQTPAGLEIVSEARLTKRKPRVAPPSNVQAALAILGSSVLLVTPFLAWILSR